MSITYIIRINGKQDDILQMLQWIFIRPYIIVIQDQIGNKPPLQQLSREHAT